MPLLPSRAVLAGLNLPLAILILAGITADHSPVSGRRTLHIDGDLRAGPGDTLRLEAGSHLIFQAGAALVMEPGSTLLATGTALQPITFECVDPVPGCWSGITLRGGGIVEHVRIRHATTGLTLEGVGGATVLDRIHVDGSSGDGVRLTGGVASLRWILLTGNQGYGLRWDGGWGGRAQFVAVVPDPDRFEGGILGRGEGGPGASGPTLFNLTVAAAPGPGHPTGRPTAVRLENGARGTIANMLLVQPGVALDLDDQATCDNLQAGDLSLGPWLVGGALSPGDPDPDPLACAGHPSPNAELLFLKDPDGPIVVRTEPGDVASLVRMSGVGPSLVDLRRPTGAAASDPPALGAPVDGFFLPAGYIGAFDPSAFGAIPWHTGWAFNVEVSLPLLPLPPFDIDVRVVGNPPASLISSLAQAEARWEGLVVGDIPDQSLQLPAGTCIVGHPVVDETVDDVLVHVEVVGIDGPGGVLARAGPCFLRAGNLLPIIGGIQFDSADLAAIEAQGVLDAVVLHEFGHLLGIGTTWGPKGLLTGAGSADPRFLGVEAATVWGGWGGTGGTPAENQGGSGTRDVHWRDSVFGDELMTGFINLGMNPLSALTARSLLDLGYLVDASGADPYLPPGPGAIPAPAPDVAPGGGWEEILVPQVLPGR